MVGGSFRIRGFVFCKLMGSIIFVPFPVLKGTLFCTKSSLMAQVSNSSQVLSLTQTILFKYPTCLRWHLTLLGAFSLLLHQAHSKVVIDRQYPYCQCHIF